MTTLRITSVCMNYNYNAWITFNGMLWCIDDITNPNGVWGKITIPIGITSLSQVSCGTRHSDCIAIIADNSIWIGTGDIITNPTWRLVPGASAKYININSDKSFFIIGTDNNIYRNMDISRGNWVRLPLPNGGNYPNPGTPVQINDYNITYNSWGMFLDSKGTIYGDNNAYSGNPASNDWWIAKQINIANVTNYAAQSDDKSWIIQNGYLRYSTNWMDGNNGFSQVGSETTNRLITGNNYSRFIVIQGDYTIKWGINNSISSTSMNGLPKPAYYGKKYYGNTTPVTKPPYVITLTNVDVLNWRQGVEYKYNMCGFSSACHGFNRSKFPYSNSGLAIETPPNKDIPYNNSIGRGNCTAGKSEAWCWVPKECLTHVFGQDGPNNIPKLKNQYGSPSAIDLQIVPFSKVMDNFTPDYRDTRYFENNKNRPKFKSVKFNLPDPTDEFIDGTIPLILIDYYKKDNLPLEVLNDYITKYAFTPIVENGKTIPRYKQSVGPNMVPHPPSIPIDIWKFTIVNQGYFDTAALSYCSLDNTINTEYCYNYCSGPTTDCDSNLLTYCRSGGSGTSKFPPLIKGILSNIPITNDMLKSAYPKYFDEKSNKTCGCFMPDDFYDYLDQNKFQEIKTTQAEYTKLYTSKAIGIGGAKCDPFSSCTGADSIKKKAIGINCPSVNLQNCIQNNSLTVGGNMKNSPVETSQTMNCVQNVTNVAPESNNLATAITAAPITNAAPITTAPPVQTTKPVPTTKPAPPTPESGLTPAMIAIIIAVVIIILGGGAFFILK